MRAVDTNVLVRILTRDDEEQLRVAEEFVRGGAWVSHLVLADVTWVLGAVYERGPAAIAAAEEMLLDHDTLILQDADAVGHAVARFRKHPALGFSDCLVLEVARKAGHVPLGTFDRGLGKVEGATRLSSRR